MCILTQLCGETAVFAGESVQGALPADDLLYNGHERESDKHLRCRISFGEYGLTRKGRGRQVNGGAQNLAGVKVMVIDDSNTIRRSAEIFLVKSGCEVILAEDGFDALSKIADHQPDVIFVDIMMPRLDGYQTCALIKKNPKFKVTPVIMLSSKDGLFDRARGRMVGSDEYLTKPFTKESLLKTVEQHTAHRHVQ